MTNEAVNGANSEVTALGDDFEKYKTSYLMYSEKLSAFEDDYPNKLANLAGWAKTYTSDEALVTKIKEDFASNVNPITEDIETIEDKLIKFLGGKDYETWSTDLA
jgi:hypothetical protein